MRYTSLVPKSEDARLLRGAELPFVFDPPVNDRTFENLPNGADRNLKTLFQARCALRAKPENWAEHVQVIRNILLGELALNGSGRLEPFHGHFAAEAARISLNHREFKLAAEMIMLGAKFAPAEPEFPYLMRLVQRESTFPPQHLLSSTH